MPDLLELAARCEAADGASYELEREIAAAVGHPSVTASSFAMQYEGIRLPNYTASLDAAVSLVPNDVREWHCGKHYKTGQGQAYMLAPKALRDPIYCLATTPALALCAAALRARAADAPNPGGHP